MSNIDQSIRRLWLSYKLYYLTSAVREEDDSSEYATNCTNGYLEYLNEMINVNNADWDYALAIENQVRILRGFIECYDRPVKKDKVVSKTRWSL